MEIQDSVTVACAPADLAPWIEDLAAYPAWMGLVHRTVSEGSDPPTWSVDLRARLGPLSRSKRLRMVRTECAAGSVRFERREMDGRRHSAWVLAATYEAVDQGTHLGVLLRYEGKLWGPLLERILREEIERAKPRLAALVRQDEAPGGPTR